MYSHAPNLAVNFIHAPPPVPTCGMQTKEYIADFTTEMLKVENDHANILIGDFNTLPFQTAIKDVLKIGYVDVSSTLNKLPKGTYGFMSRLPKLLKLDYVFCKGQITPKYITRFSLNSSDHSGFVVDFEL